jgi:hypothetical protein
MRIRVLLAVFLVLALAAPLGAQTERILDFDSTVIVDAEGMLTVSETITVQAAGDQIKRGIVREFPTVYDGRGGKKVKVGFKLIDVTRDGRPEPHHVEKRSNGVAIYAGKKDVFLPPGRYTYTFVYTTTRQLGLFEDHDELYWNVNGNGWRLPLDRVACEVVLPEGALAIEAVAYEGPKGSTDSRRFEAGSGRVVFESSRPYAPGEGLTIAVSWPKGFVTPPPEPGLAETVVEEGGGLAFAGLGAVLLLAYYVLAWVRVGRDPAKGVIIARFGPPRGFSPAMVRMLWRMKFDNAAFSAAVVDIAVKGGLKISDNAKMRLDLAPAPPADLSAGERALWEELHKGGGSVELKNTNHRIVNRARQALKGKLSKELSSTYFPAFSERLAHGLDVRLRHARASGLGGLAGQGRHGQVRRAGALGVHRPLSGRRTRGPVVPVQSDKPGRDPGFSGHDLHERPVLRTAQGPDPGRPEDSGRDRGFSPLSLGGRGGTAQLHPPSRRDARPVREVPALRHGPGRGKSVG